MWRLRIESNKILGKILSKWSLKTNGKQCREEETRRICSLLALAERTGANHRRRGSFGVVPRRRGRSSAAIGFLFRQLRTAFRLFEAVVAQERRQQLQDEPLAVGRFPPFHFHAIPPPPHHFHPLVPNPSQRIHSWWLIFWLDLLT